MFKTIFPFLLMLALLGGCQGVPKSFDVLGGGDCLDISQPVDHSRFVAYGSGSSLERATSSAQASLAQQISSTVSSEVKSAVRLKGDGVTEEGSVVIRLVSENIPLDQHRVGQTCYSGGTHYVEVSLEKAALVRNSQIRLKNQQRAIEQNLKQARRKSNYERYLIREQLQQQLVKLALFDVLLQQYGDGHNSQPARAVAAKAHAFIDSNSHLRINVSAPKNMRPLLSPLENALRRAELDYGPGNRHAAAEIKIKGRPQYQSANGRHVTHIDAVIEVRRIDTGELLASLRLGKKTGTSSVSRSKSLEIALKKHVQSLKRKLHGNKAAIRKALGIS